MSASLGPGVAKLLCEVVPGGPASCLTQAASGFGGWWPSLSTLHPLVLPCVTVFAAEAWCGCAGLLAQTPTERVPTFVPTSSSPRFTLPHPYSVLSSDPSLQS